MKYIDAERLKAELEKRLKNTRDYMTGVGMKYKGPKYYKAQGKESAYDALLSIIDSLQQEQPEVDLEKEIDAVWNPRFNLGWDEHSALSMNHAGFASIARHFYELGRNAIKED